MMDLMFSLKEALARTSKTTPIERSVRVDRDAASQDTDTVETYKRFVAGLSNISDAEIERSLRRC